MIPPRPPRRPHHILQHGRERLDDYAWMKDSNWREVLRDPARLDPEIRRWLEAENAYADRLLSPVADLRKAIAAELRGRIKEDDASAPFPDGPFDYFIRYETGAQHPRHCRRPRDAEGPETVLLDEAAEASGLGYYHVAEARHSPDHRLFGWTSDTSGAEYYALNLSDVATGERLPEGPTETTGAFAFSPDSRWLFWIWRDENARPSRVYRRPARGGEDALVHKEADEGMFLGLSLTADRRYILVEIENQETSEIRIIPAEDPTARPIVARPRQSGVRYDLDHWGDRWVIRNNAGGATDFALHVSSAVIPTAETWRPFAEHRGGRLIAGFALYSDHLVRIEREDAQDRLVVMPRDGGPETPIEFDEAAYALALAPGFEFETSLARVVHQSPTTPREWFDIDLGTGARTLRKRQTVPSGHDPSAYETRRLHARAPDGAEVPITLLMRRGAPADGSAPVLLYGYGAYGYAQEPVFSTQALSLVDRGWIWAWTHVRGGSDKGWGWFLDGRGARKTNTFTDFIACAEHLIAGGYTRAGRITAYGGSAGGMLVGAALNLRPDLFGAAIAAVPFVDVLNTMSDADLPLTPPEWPEWGNPLADPGAYDRIAAYSPYDNVAPRPYPAVLARAGLSDPRVTWWEPQKWIARLREATTSGRPVLLKVNLDAGHGGASGRFDHLEEVALDYAFAIWALEGDDVTGVETAARP